MITAIAVLAARTALIAYAQDSRSVECEVASVKVARPDDDAFGLMQGGPGTPYPERITYERQPLTRFLIAAYGVDFDQISGPAWIGKELYSVVANVPPGTTLDQLKLMWQHLLVERFHLKTHMIKKDFAAYELSVAKSEPCRSFRHEPFVRLFETIQWRNWPGNSAGP